MFECAASKAQLEFTWGWHTIRLQMIKQKGCLSWNPHLRVLLLNAWSTSTDMHPVTVLEYWSFFSESSCFVQQPVLSVQVASLAARCINLAEGCCFVSHEKSGTVYSDQYSLLLCNAASFANFSFPPKITTLVVWLILLGVVDVIKYQTLHNDSTYLVYLLFLLLLIAFM